MSNVLDILNELNKSNTKLVVASKYINATQIKKLINDFDIHNFGENRVDAFLSKYDELKNENITWHFIGHLQTNKVTKDLVNKINVLHSLDSLKLANLINKYRDLPLDTFIEVHLTDSETKSGVLPENLDDFINNIKTNFPKVNIVGLMTMSDKTQSDEEKEKVFLKLYELAQKYNLKELSMGMSDDYKIALKCHSTCVRLGRIICNEVM